MDNRRLFPIQSSRMNHPDGGRRDMAPTREIPWDVAEEAYKDYSRRFGSDQSLERLAERGGFSSYEMDLHYGAWRQELGLPALQDWEGEQLSSWWQGEYRAAKNKKGAGQ